MKRDISVILVCLIIAVFFIRIGILKKQHLFSYDEIVYSTLAAQIAENPADYNTIKIYQNARKKGRELPVYFNKPLFKHPPLFPYFISFSYKLFGTTYHSAFRVSLFFGVLLIVLAYLWGATAFDNRAGVYAAVLMSIEPVSWITSQKIWMETTLAFFTLLSLYLFARAVKKYNPYLIMASGVSAGLAALCKYPGLLSTGAVFLYALCRERWLFRKKAFIVSLFIPLIMLIPWIWWNYMIYGRELFASNTEITHLLRRLKMLVLNFRVVFSLAVLAATGLAVVKRNLPSFYERFFLKRVGILWQVFVFGLFCFIVFVLREHLINAADFRHIPATGWEVGMFRGQPWYFYPGRLIELSPFYVFSFAGLLLLVFDRRYPGEYSFLLFTALIILAFYVLWGNYQCRYITGVVVPLMVLSARVQLYIWARLSNIRLKGARYAALFLFVLVIAYAAAKTLRVDFVLAVPNGTCYF